MFGFGKKKTSKKATETAKRIERNSQKVVERVMKQTEPIRRENAIFEASYPLYMKGEDARKAGDIATALYYYDQAKKNGYKAPALWKSYAMAYRRLKDVTSEIAVLEEGIRELTKANGKIGDTSTGLRDLKEQLKKAKAKLK